MGHALARHAWDVDSRQLVMGAWRMHYGLDSLPHVKVGPDAPEIRWEYDPASRAWTPVPRGPDLGLGHICYVPSLGRTIGFSGANVPVALYDPTQRTFQAFRGFRGSSPEGYT
jgi:hypothetical protein